jgi:hypothetical protein
VAAVDGVFGEFPRPVVRPRKHAERMTNGDPISRIGSRDQKAEEAPVRPRECLPSPPAVPVAAAPDAIMGVMMDAMILGSATIVVRLRRRATNQRTRRPMP